MGNNDSYLSTFIELFFAKALAANKNILAISYHRAAMKPHAELAHRQAGAGFADATDCAQLDSLCILLLQQTNHLGVRNLGIVDQQFLASSLYKIRQRPSGVDWTNHE